MRFLHSASTLLLIVAPATTASAGQIIAQLNGLTGTDHLIDFGANLYPNFTDITTEFPGITCSHTRYFTTGSVNNMVGGFLTNDFSGSPYTMSVKFDSAIEDLSFAYHQIGTGQSSVFRALLGGVPVDSFSYPASQTAPNNYFGFTGLLFDELQIDFVSDFNIDSLAYNDPGSGLSGTPGCDGSSGVCPCVAVGAVDQGCPNSASANGGRLVGSGTPSVVGDTFALSVSECALSKPGLVLSGTADLSPGLNTIADSAGLLCVGGMTQRGDVVFTDASGAASLPDFQGADYGQASNVTVGSPSYYQYWYRDPGTACPTSDTAAADFNFTNQWEVTWMM